MKRFLLFPLLALGLLGAFQSVTLTDGTALVPPAANVLGFTSTDGFSNCRVSVASGASLGGGVLTAYSSGDLIVWTTVSGVSDLANPSPTAAPSVGGALTYPIAGAKGFALVLTGSTGASVPVTGNCNGASIALHQSGNSPTFSGVVTLPSAAPLYYSSPWGAYIRGNATVNSGVGAPGWVYDLTNGTPTTGDIADFEILGSAYVRFLPVIPGATTQGGVWTQGPVQSQAGLFQLLNPSGGEVDSAAIGSAEAVSVKPTASPFTGNIMGWWLNASTEGAWVGNKGQGVFPAVSQTAANSFEGSCSNTSGNGCTATATAPFASTPQCFAWDPVATASATRVNCIVTGSSGAWTVTIFTPYLVLGGTCTMASATTCTSALTYKLASQQCLTQPTVASITVSGACTSSSSTLTVTANVSNSLTWTWLELGLPNNTSRTLYYMLIGAPN